MISVLQIGLTLHENTPTLRVKLLEIIIPFSALIKIGCIYLIDRSTTKDILSVPMTFAEQSQINLLLFFRIKCLLLFLFFLFQSIANILCSCTRQKPSNIQRLKFSKEQLTFFLAVHFGLLGVIYLGTTYGSSHRRPRIIKPNIH